MAIEVKWSTEAEITFEENIKYLLDQWTHKEVHHFVQQTEYVTTRLKEHPESYNPSQKNKRVRRARLNKYVTLYYQSTVELSKEYNINQKSAWLFKRKAQEAMKSSGKYPLNGKVEVDEFMIGGPEEKRRGRSKGDKKLIVLAVEKVKGDKIGRAYAQVIEEASGACFRPFFEQHIDKDEARVKTDGWKGYLPLQSEFEITQKASCKREKLQRATRCDHERKGLAEGNPP